MSQLVKRIRTDAGDLQIDYNSLANLPVINNNLLINSDFRNPVNQRDLYTYTSNPNSETWIYTIDRWRIKGLDLTINTGRITIENNGSVQNNMQQPIGYYLPTGTYTVSCKVLSVSGNVSMGVTGTTNNPKLVVGINSKTWQDIEIGSFSIALDAGASVSLEWVKLECGSVATPFAPRLYTEELILCQRFYRRVRRVPIYATSSSSLTYMLPIQFGVPMAENHNITLLEVLNSGGNIQSDVTLDQCLSGTYNTQTLKLSRSIGQYGFVTMTFDAEIY